jgi:hypothetical protein
MISSRRALLLAILAALTFGFFSGLLAVILEKNPWLQGGIANEFLHEVFSGGETQKKVAGNENNVHTSSMFILPSPFLFTFNSAGTLQEAGSALESTSPYFWLNSGGKLVINGANGTTIEGDLPVGDKWHTLYATSNPLDTDNGLHPQNLFRLVTKSSWENTSASADFKIDKDNLSTSPNRNASNGLLLMSRYASDGQTLYYAGIRVDGTAVIKKKYHGVYYTMAQKQIFPGTYNASTSPNLLPHGEWISLKSDTVTNADGSVTVTLSMKRAGETAWTKLLTSTDTGTNFGGTPPITGLSLAGIRTDFMDVEFDNYRLQNF